MWKGVTGLVEEIKRCEKAGATVAAVCMAYVCIDTMAFLSLPASQASQTRNDFINWVDTYLKGDPGQPYQYCGVDVYAARCAVLHAFSSEAQLHVKDPGVKLFGYHDGGKHAFDPAQAPNLVIVGTASFLNDLVIAVETFMRACIADPALRALVEGRLPKVLQTFSVS